VTAPGPDPILTVADARHAYGERTVLRGVDLTLRRGEIYALLGPNGAGKTTLIRAVCGRLKPDAGEVRLGGRDPFRDRSARALLGLVPQSLALYSHLTVAENLEVFGRLSGVRGAALKAASAHAMEVTHIADRARTLVKQLSGGLQRRVNIAAAILHHPSLLVLDEPTVGVDPPAREAVSEVLRTLRSEHVAIVMITHDLDQAGELADRVGFLREGTMALEGEPARLIAAAFGDQMEVQVDLVDEPDASQALRLTAEGLAQGRSPGSWSCLSDDGYGLAARLDRRLKQAGLGAREVRVRRPSLQSLFTRVTEMRRAA
jgi:ABC-2 type transport system ATP-binding protein